MDEQLAEIASLTADLQMLHQEGATRQLWYQEQAASRQILQLVHKNLSVLLDHWGTQYAAELVRGHV